MRSKPGFHDVLNPVSGAGSPGLASLAPQRTHVRHHAPIPPAATMSKTPETGGAAVAMRDLSAARDAYKDRDLEASKAAHKAKVLGAPEQHKKIGGHLKSIVYGGLDGIITTFAVVAGAAGTRCMCPCGRVGWRVPG